MVHNRQLIPKEMMQVMGLEVFEKHLPGSRQFLPGFEQLVLQDKISNQDIVHACGNGMTQISVGSMLMFTLGSYGSYAEQVPFPIRDADAEGEPQMSDAEQVPLRIRGEDDEPQI